MDDNFNDFMKKAYDSGKIKDVEEAFKEFPVEEEYHKGKVELLLNESGVEYTNYQVGDIVFVKEFLYKNGNTGINHLFVIIDKNNIIIPIDYLGMIISYKLGKLKYDENILIKKDTNNNLDKDSIIKTDVLYKVRNSQILFKIGNVDIERVEEYKRLYTNFWGGVVCQKLWMF